MTKFCIAFAWIFSVLNLLEGPGGGLLGFHQVPDAIRADCMATACFWVGMAIYHRLREERA